MRPLRSFVLAVWVAFLCRGAIHALMAPMWDNFDEPGHLAYILFIDDHLRPPGYEEPSFPKYFVDANAHLPSTVGHGAPAFAQWRAMSASDRDRERALADQLAGNPRRYTDYVSPNYERQQGPLFYWIAAIPGLVLRRLTLPKLVVAMRLFCVLLASAAIPIGSRFLDRLGRARAIAIGLPLLAFAPNTIFVFDRISNETLALPLMTAIALYLVIREPSPRDFVMLGSLAAAGLWTRLTFACVLPAIAVAVWMYRRRRGAWLALAIPSIAAGALLTWNKVASGHFAGLNEQSIAGHVSLADVRKALRHLGGIPVGRDFIKGHLWSGGWGFVRPPGFVYAIAVLLIAATIVIALVKNKRRSWEWPFVVMLAAFLMEAAVQVITCAIAAIKVPGSVTLGAAGWYLDELRPAELAIVVPLLCGAFASKWFSRGVLALCVIADFAGLTLLLIPHWAGGVLSVHAAIDAAPVRRTFVLLIVLLAGYLAAITLALLRSPASGEAAASATP